MNRHFGGAGADVEVAPWVWRAPAGQNRREALLFELVALSCVAETLSTALLGVLVERATDSEARQTLREILRDEVHHARLGWAYLAWDPSPTARHLVGRRLPAMLGGTLTDELFRDGESDPDEAALSGLGQLERAERRAVVRDTLEQVVFPGLERFGIDVRGGKEWLAAAEGRPLGAQLSGA
jgi:hypothetical protein